MTLPYIPPRSPGDPPAEELVMAFLEAVARATRAFRQLRDDAIPAEGIGAWMHTWHLDFDNYELREMIFGHTLQLLRYWVANPEARKALAVDAGLWEYLKSPKRRMSSDKKPGVLLSRWNPDRESHAIWANRARADFDGYIRDEKRRAEAELQKYRARAYAPTNPLAFDWLAMHVCLKLSAADIVRLSPDKLKLNRETVKKAVRDLAGRLRMNDTP